MAKTSLFRSKKGILGVIACTIMVNPDRLPRSRFGGSNRQNEIWRRDQVNPAGGGILSISGGGRALDLSGGEDPSNLDFNIDSCVTVLCDRRLNECCSL